MKKILSVLIALLLAAFCVFPAMAEDSDDPVIFTENSYYCVGYNMTVDIESMTDYDARVWNAFIEGGVQYAWYLDYEFYSSSQSIYVAPELCGRILYVQVTCYDLVFESDHMLVYSEGGSGAVYPEFITTSLPEATVGELYNVHVQCTADDAMIGVYYNPGHKNEFEETGLTISSDGIISGYPTEPGSYTFTLYAIGEGGDNYMEYTLVVNEASETSKPENGSEPDTDTEESKIELPSGNVSIIITTSDGENKLDFGATTDTAPDSDRKGMTGAGVIILVVLGVIAALLVPVLFVIIVVILIIILVKKSKKKKAAKAAAEAKATAEAAIQPEAESNENTSGQ